MLKFLYYSNQSDQYWKSFLMAYEGVFCGQVWTRMQKYWISQLRPPEVKTWSPFQQLTLMRQHP